METKKYHFKGFSWNELAECWNIKGSKKKIREHLGNAIGGQNLKEAADDCRAFLRALAKESKKLDYCAPVWEGMLKIKDDHGGNETLLRFVVDNLDSMWS